MGAVGGGAERVLSHVLFELVPKGWDLTLVTFDEPGAASFYSLPETIRWQQLGSPPVQNKAGSILWRAARLRRHFRAHRPERVVAFMSSSSVPAAMALLGSDASFIVSEHIVVSHYDDRRIERSLLGWAFNRACAVTMITPRMLADFDGFWPGQNYQLVPNPVPVSLQQEQLSYGPSPRYKIVAAGTLEARKNFGLLIEAFSRIALKYPDWSLEIWGRGPLREELEALTSSLGLRGRVSLPGSTPELLDKMGEGHIFAMPSILESFGMVSLEAMSVGLPVVGLRRCLGTNEVVQHERTGLLVDSDDLVGGFADALERLIRSPEERERFGRAGLEAAKQYDQRRVGDLWHELLLQPARQSTRPVSSA